MQRRDVRWWCVVLGCGFVGWGDVEAGGEAGGEGKDCHDDLLDKRRWRLSRG